MKKSRWDKNGREEEVITRGHSVECIPPSRHIEIDTVSHFCFTYLQLENESESSGLTGNFEEPRIVMHCWPTGKLRYARYPEYVPGHSKIQSFFNPPISQNFTKIHRNFLDILTADKQTNGDENSTSAEVADVTEQNRA